MTPDVIGPTVVGQPVVWGTGFIVLVLLLLPATSTWAGSLVTAAHEGGHVAMVILTGRPLEGFQINETTGGGVTVWREGGNWSVGRILIHASGYTTPPLLGLGGANLVVTGQAWSVLWVSLVLLLGAWLTFRGLFTGLVVLLAGAAIVWVALAASYTVQEAVAVAIVWLLLIGGVTSLRGQGWGRSGSDAAQLSQQTWIPAFLWVAFFGFVAIVCLWIGARRLTGL